MKGELKIRIRTLTPLWTGGVDGICDRLHETGLIGSLRWWYEAIVRGLGGYACDPTEHRCRFDEKKYRESRATSERKRLLEAGVCDACQVFGATGWRRRFRLEVVDDETTPAWNPPPDMLNVRPPGRQRGWFLPPGRMGTLTLRFVGDEDTLKLLASLMLFLERWGNLGAKPQLGYGVFRIENRDELLKEVPSKRWEKIGDAGPDKARPDLRRFGFFQYWFKPAVPQWWLSVPGLERLPADPLQRLLDSGTVPIAPALKNEWRFNRWKGQLAETVHLFGSSEWKEREEWIRIRSKVVVSWAYRVAGGWEVRGFVWLPDDAAASRAWKAVTDPEGWHKVLPWEGVLKTVPEKDWRKQFVEEVIALLNYDL